MNCQINLSARSVPSISEQPLHAHPPANDLSGRMPKLSIKFLGSPQFFDFSVQVQPKHLVAPQKISDRLREYIQDKGIGPENRISPIACNAAMIMVKKAGELAGVNLRPHDLRRHAATLASRSGTPIEIVSKVILRHAHLSTTQRYLGK
jgi:hypothetical protein